MGIQLVVGGAALAVLVLWSGTIPRSSFEFQAFFEERQMAMVMLAALPMTAADFGLIWLFRRFLDRHSLASLGFVRPGSALWNSVWGGLLFGALPIILVIGILLAVGGFEWEGVSASAWTGLLVPVLFVMAFNEEIVCRGYLLQNLVDIGKPVLGILFSSAVFCTLHAVNPGAQASFLVPLNLFGAGIVLALAYLASGNIWFPTALHFGWNFAQGVLFQAPISGLTTDGLLDVQTVTTMPDWLTGGTFGIEGSVLTTAVEIGLSLVFWSVRRKRTHQITAATGPVLAPTNESPFFSETPLSGAASEVPRDNDGPAAHNVAVTADGETHPDPDEDDDANRADRST